MDGEKEKSVVGGDASKSADAPNPRTNLLLLENLPVVFDATTVDQLINVSKVFSNKTAFNVLQRYVFSHGPRKCAIVEFDEPEAAEEVEQALLKVSEENEKFTRVFRISRPVPQPTCPSFAPKYYPFAPMSVKWLIQFVSSIPGGSPINANLTMCGLLECLMSAAVVSSDYMMEDAAVVFYTGFPQTSWAKATSFLEDSVAFDRSRQVFEVLSLMRKYSTGNVRSKRMLLTLVERVIDDVSRVSTNTRLASTRAIPDIISSIRAGINTLKATLAQSQGTDQPQVQGTDPVLAGLISWMKFLFACLLPNNSQIPTFPDGKSFSHCSPSCPCYAKAKTAGVVGSDAEKAKIMDSLLIHFVHNKNNAASSNIAASLLLRYHGDYLLRASYSLHNHEYFAARLCIFFALQIEGEHFAVALSHIEGAVRLTEQLVNKKPELQSIQPLIESSLEAAYNLRNSSALAAHTVTQQQYALKYTLEQILTHLCAVQYQLCVHAGDEIPQTFGPRLPECGNPLCSAGPLANLMKCSGCRSVYYCSPACQKQDWKAHKPHCKEASAKRATTTERVSCAAATGMALLSCAKPNHFLEIKPIF